MDAPGWSDFDVAVVQQLRRGDPAVVDKTPGGGLRCPLIGHDHWIAWKDGSYRNGTDLHRDLPIRFRVSPTYILDDPLDNFVVGRELVAGALGGDWKKAETFRLGHENSEDAVSWNVFRALQEADRLPLAVEALTGIRTDAEIELMLWGRRIGLHDTAPTTELGHALNALEPTHSQQTEPDVVLRLADWGWIFIEAKLASTTTTYAAKPSKLKSWVTTYADASPGLFSAAALESATADTFPEQLLRNVAVANAALGSGEQAVVVALVREQYAAAVDDWAQDFLLPDSPVSTGSATWEQLYAALPPDDHRLASLRNYLMHKSVGLRPAFAPGQITETP